MNAQNRIIANAIDAAAAYRLLALAALDQLHEAQQAVACQERIIARLKDELCERMGVPSDAELR